MDSELLPRAPGVDEAIAEYEPSNRLMTEGEWLESEVAAIQVTDEDSAERATDLGGRIQRALKAAETERRRLTQPLNQVLRRINARFKKFTSGIEEAKRSLGTKLLRYRRQQEQAERKEREAREAEARRQREEAETAALRRAEELERQGKPEGAERVLDVATFDAGPPVPVPATPAGPIRGRLGSGFSKRTVWTFKVVDVQALAAAHPELVQPIDKLIRAQVNAGAREIAGVEIYQEDQGAFI